VSDDDDKRMGARLAMVALYRCLGDVQHAGKRLAAQAEVTEAALRAAGDENAEAVRVCAEITSDVRCSFCARTRTACRVLIAGPQVWICDSCASLAHEMAVEKKEATHA
jgi:ribosomal protein L37AE/L43A